MDRVTSYKYSYGRVKEIIEGKLPKINFDVLDAGNLFREIKGKSFLILPKLLGIYQITDLIFDENEYHEEEKITYKDLCMSKYSSTKNILQLIAEKNDDIDPELICLVYDKSLIPGNIARKMFNDEAGRIKLCDKDCIPKFYDKNTAQINFFVDKLENKGKESLGEILKKERKIAEDASARLTNQLKEYGLTREEYMFLEIMDNMKKDPAKSKHIHVIRGMNLEYIEKFLK